ncbi:MAG: ABC transporter permease, partial [Owenweeksia sp.]
KTRVDLKTINIEEGKEQQSMTLIKMGIGYIAGFLIYLFVFIYGAQIMRGVIEEKTSRIVEVMVSSVKPFELMMGKIIGLASVALLQFMIWLVFGVALYFVAAIFILGDAVDTAQIAAPGYNASNNVTFQIMNTLGQINFPYIISCFLFFFLCGYLLYAALFAAIGSAVDKESDTQQFMFPVSLPLIASIIVLIRALDNPDGAIAFWFSIIPFTSPIVMMARIPFSVPWWELALSMLLLVGAFLAMTWIAGRIYRTGILMYGKKPKLKELFKWITYRQ